MFSLGSGGKSFTPWWMAARWLNATAQVWSAPKGCRNAGRSPARQHCSWNRMLMKAPGPLVNCSIEQNESHLCLTPGSPYCALVNIVKCTGEAWRCISLKLLFFLESTQEQPTACPQKSPQGGRPLTLVERVGCCAVLTLTPVSPNRNLIYLERAAGGTGGRWPWEHEEKLACYLLSLFGLI